MASVHQRSSQDCQKCSLCKFVCPVYCVHEFIFTVVEEKKWLVSFVRILILLFTSTPLTSVARIDVCVRRGGVN